MILLALLNFSLLGNISTTLDLTTNFIPRAKVDIVETSNYSFSSRYLNTNKDLASSIDFKNLPDLSLKPVKPVTKSTVTAATKTFKKDPKPTGSTELLTINKIGIKDLKLARSSISTIDDMNKKMLYYPVVENIISPDLCSNYGNSYISGHSEPTSSLDKNYPAVNVFSNLNLVVAGDIIEIKSTNGLGCSYRVTGWDTATTDQNNKVSNKVFANAYYPINDKPTLTIQTCQKGSATVRLLLRAEKI